MPAPVRIGIVEDDAFIVTTLSALIDATDGYQVVGTASSATEYHQLVAAHFPDVVLVDVRLGSDDGIAMVAATDRSALKTAVVFMTAHLDARIVHDALEVGLSGFLHKADVARLWKDAVDEARTGGVLFSPIVGAAIAQRAADPARYAERIRYQRGVARLNDLDRRVLGLLPSGATVSEMAEELHCGVTTVKSSISQIVAALGVDNRQQAGALAARHAH